MVCLHECARIRRIKIVNTNEILECKTEVLDAKLKLAGFSGLRNVIFDAYIGETPLNRKDKRMKECGEPR